MHSQKKYEAWYPQIRLWLYAVLLSIFALIIIGGATRLTDSGLSITEWQPIIGIIPPLNAMDWQEAFSKYQQIPEFQLINRDMGLAEFKTLYWWEWGHRFLGRFTGLVFLLPFLYFLVRRRIGPQQMTQLIALFALGGLQGALGWYMVRSGLVDRVDVSQYRLAAHLGLALIILSFVLWIARGLGRLTIPAERSKASRTMVAMAAGLCTMVFLQIILGALVAGTDAGLSYNSWPLIDGALVPSGLFNLSPWYLNFLENPLTIQFDHRTLAYIIIILALLHLIWITRHYGDGRLLVFSALLLVSVVLQIVVGIWVLLMVVPLELGLLHQAGGIIVFLISVLQLQETLWHQRAKTCDHSRK